MKYKVGQVFYLVGSETAKVIPFRIVEEVTRTTLTGQDKTYIAELPDEKHTNIDVGKLKGTTFCKLSDLRKHMLDNANSAIDAMIADAEKLANIAYSLTDEISLPESAENEPTKASDNKTKPHAGEVFSVLGKDEVAQQDDSVQIDNKSDIVKVDIGNGVVANMSMKDLEKVSQI